MAHSPVPKAHAPKKAHLKQTIDTIGKNCKGHRVSLGTIADSIQTRDFGLLILVPALIMLLPVSLIPGLSPLCSVVILIASLHILFGRKTLWMPKRLRKVSFNGNNMTHTLKKLDPVADKIEHLSKRHLAFLTKGPAEKLTTGAIIILASATTVLGFIPLVDIVLMIPVVLFGLGIYTQNGLITAAGWIVLLLSVGSIRLFT